jgi:hypothetical protein
MSEVVYAIPSYNRATGITKKTLATLHYYDIPKSNIYIFVNTDEQVKDYKDKIPSNLYGHIIATKQAKGIKNVRNYIVDYFKENQKFISMDDDVISINTLDTNDKLTKIKSLKDVVKEGFDLCKKYGYTLWGLYPVANAFYMKGQKEYTTDLRFIVGGFMGIINKKRKVNLDWKEDYELSLEAYNKDGGVIRFNRICVKHTLYSKVGGIGQSQQERMNNYKDAGKWLIEHYPNLVRWNPNREGEILLNKGLKEKEKEVEGGKLYNLDKIPIEDTESTKVIVDKIEASPAVKEIQERLLALLDKARIPKIEGKRKDNNKSRGDLLGYEGWTFTMGIGRRRGLGVGEFLVNEREPELFKCVVEYGNKILPTGFKYTTITINRNLPAKKHFDGGNSGFGCITFLGDYTGGGLFVYDENDKPTLYDTHNKVIIFNGANLAHKTEPFKNTRYALIYYNQQFDKSIKGVKMEGSSVHT